MTENSSVYLYIEIFLVPISLTLLFELPFMSHGLCIVGAWMSMKLQPIILAILTVLNQTQKELDVTSSWVVTVSGEYVQCVRYVRLGVPHDIAQHPYYRSVWYLSHVVSLCFGLCVISL